VSSVQSDVWTILKLALVGIVPLALVLGYMFLRSKRFKPNAGEPSDAYHEALYEEKKRSARLRLFPVRAFRVVGYCRSAVEVYMEFFCGDYKLEDFLSDVIWSWLIFTVSFLYFG